MIVDIFLTLQKLSDYMNKLSKNIAGNEARRFDGLDAIKTICALLIVIIHVNAKYMYFDIDCSPVVYFFSALARVGVPVFFMITGFFFQSLYDRKRLPGYCKKIIKIFITGILFYVLLTVFIQVRGHIAVKSVIEYICHLFDLSTFEKWMAFPAVAGHLWYLISLVNAILVVWALEAIGLRRKLYWLIPVLLLANYAIGTFYSSFYCRNFLFTGIPYILFGCFIHDYKERMQEIFTTKKSCIILMITILLLVGELKIYSLYGLPVVRDHYFITPFMAVALFMLGLNPTIVWNKILINIGNIYSTNIYVYHYAFVSLFYAIGLYEKIHFFLASLIVFLATLIFVFSIRQAKLLAMRKHG